MEMESQMASLMKAGGRKRNHRSRRKVARENYDSDSENAVTSTSGQRVSSSTRKPGSNWRKASSKTLSRSLSLSAIESKTPKQLKRQKVLIKSEPSSTDVRVPEHVSDEGNSRLLMRDWLIQELSRNRIPGLQWHDESKKQFSISWIHGLKEGWSVDSHCLLFKQWATYTGKYDPKKDKANPKRWKANFRCALNSLPDVKEVCELSQKNGKNGFKVYQFDNPIVRKSHRKLKLVIPSSPNDSSLDEDATISNEKPINLSSNTATASSASSTSTNFSHCNGFTDSLGNPMFVSASDKPKTEPCKQENGSVSNEAMQTDDVSAIAVKPSVSDISNVEREKSMNSQKGHFKFESDIISLRNLDHNYFRIQIPTTVENYADD